MLEMSVLLLLLFLLLPVVTGELSIVPTNTLTTVNNSVTFCCHTTLVNSSVYWSHRELNQFDDKSIFVNGQTVSNRFRVNTTAADGQYHLIIDQVRLTDAGRFACLDDCGFGSAAVAHLVVLLSPPVCTCSHVTGVVSQGEAVHFWCSVRYSGHMTSHVTWYKQETNGTEALPAVTSTSKHDELVTDVESHLEILAGVNDIGYIKFNLVFQPQSTRLSSITSTANVSHTWVSSYIPVHYSVRHVTVHNVSSDDIFHVGQLVRCTARGKPAPEISWKHFQTGNITTGEELKLEVAGASIVYQCIASNVVNNITHTETSTITITVVNDQLPAELSNSTITSDHLTSTGRQDATAKPLLVHGLTASLVVGGGGGVVVVCLLLCLAVKRFCSCCRQHNTKVRNNNNSNIKRGRRNNVVKLSSSQLTSTTDLYKCDSTERQLSASAAANNYDELNSLDSFVAYDIISEQTDTPPTSENNTSSPPETVATTTTTAATAAPNDIGLQYEQLQCLIVAIRTPTVYYDLQAAIVCQPATTTAAAVDSESFVDSGTGIDGTISGIDETVDQDNDDDDDNNNNNTASCDYLLLCSDDEM